MKPRSPRLPAQVAVMGLLFVMAIYFLLPAWWLLVASSKSSSSLYDTPAFWFGGGFELGGNMSDVMSYDNGIFVRWMINSLLYAGGGALVATVLAAMAGYALAKFAFRGRELVFSVIIAGVLIPPPLLAVPQYLLMSDVGLANSYWAVFLPSVVSPFGVYLARIYAASAVPDELLEAARIDGAGELRTFRMVGLRLMSPALVTIFLFQFVAIWNNFFLPLVMLADNELWPLTLGLFFWISGTRTNPEFFALTITGALISIVPLVIAFLCLQRYWRSGLAAGAVKM